MMACRARSISSSRASSRTVFVHAVRLPLEEFLNGAGSFAPVTR
jgi:hypothetical protein